MKKDEHRIKQTLPQSEEEWKHCLDDDSAYQVLRCKCTEYPGSSELLHETRHGIFCCRACHTPLFHSDKKYDSKSGWPSFWDVEKPDLVDIVLDSSHGTTRLEVICKKCKSHLGHVFPDGPAPTGRRYCINGVALKFTLDNL